MVGKELRQLYLKVQEQGCDRNCSNCELYLTSRNECIFEAKKKWEKWTRNESQRFEELLKMNAKENRDNVSK